MPTVISKRPMKTPKHSHIPSHALAWMSVLALVFSATTMTLAASAQTTSTACNQNSIAGVRCLIRQLSDKLDVINKKLDNLTPPVRTTEVPSNSISNSTSTEPIPDHDGTLLQKKTIIPGSTTDVTQCRQSCEDTFNVCATQAGQDQNKYAICKTTYSTCFGACGQ